MTEAELILRRTWKDMFSRCFDPTNAAFDNYGGRGITVCKRWYDLKNFMADMGERPPKHSIERIDNNKGYEPSNCKWATIIEQSDNRRTCRKITYKGKTQTISRWAEEYGIKVPSLFTRLVTCKMPIEEALTRPIKRSGRFGQANKSSLKLKPAVSFQNI